MTSRARHVHRLAVLALALGACVGQVEPGDEPGPAEGGPIQPGRGGSSHEDTTGRTAAACRAPAGALRRLTREEYENSVRDLFGELALDWRLPPAFPQDERPENLYVGQGVTTLWAAKALEAAELIAQRALADLARFQTSLCGGPTRAGDAPAEQACVDRVISGFAPRVYRRPLRDDEKQSLRALFADVRRPDADGTVADFRDGLQAIVQALLSAPHFFYRAEVPPAGPAESTVTGHEMAARLASFLWRSTPDQTLLAAAAAGELSTAGQVSAQARRMVAAPRARTALAGFFQQWLGLVDMPEVRRVDPLFKPALGEALVGSAMAAVEAAAWQDGKGLHDLLASREVFVDGVTAPLFGIAAARAPRAGFGRVAVDQPERVGLLTHPALMTLLAKPDGSDYIQRGKFVREQLLCMTLGAPPPAAAGVAEQVAERLGPGASARTLAEAHAAEPACKACHALIDPIGLALESFDELGRFRATRAGKAIETAGALTATDVDGPVAGAGALALRLAGSTTVSACLAEKLLQYALAGVLDHAQAHCHAQALARPAPLAELLVAVAASPALRTRASGDER